MEYNGKNSINDIKIFGLENLERLICYEFKNKELLTLSLIHTSFANEHNIEKKWTNQRLEFLGDGVLQVIVSDELYQRYEDADEGLLTRNRSLIVKEASLACIARELQLYRYLKLGKGEPKEKIKENNSTLCDTIEALIGAIYLDGGIEKAKEFVYRFILTEENIKLNIKNTDNKDYKTKLQEIMAKVEKTIRYEVIREKGPSHKKVFYIGCFIDNKMESEACGKNKKEAEQEAARIIIEKINLNGGRK